MVLPPPCAASTHGTAFLYLTDALVVTASSSLSSASLPSPPPHCFHSTWLLYPSSLPSSLPYIQPCTITSTLTCAHTCTNPRALSSALPCTIPCTYPSAHPSVVVVHHPLSLSVVVLHHLLLCCPPPPPLSLPLCVGSLWQCLRTALALLPLSSPWALSAPLKAPSMSALPWCVQHCCAPPLLPSSLSLLSSLACPTTPAGRVFLGHHHQLIVTYIHHRCSSSIVVVPCHPPSSLIMLPPPSVSAIVHWLPSTMLACSVGIVAFILPLGSLSAGYQGSLLSGSSSSAS